MPILTDYTIICKREILDYKKDFCILSKSYSVGRGAFIFEKK
jgi:hypothetical protein